VQPLLIDGGAYLVIFELPLCLNVIKIGEDNHGRDCECDSTLETEAVHELVDNSWTARNR